MLSGYKTYLCGLAIIFVVGLESLGWLTPEAKEFLLQLLGGGAILAIRSAIKNMGK